VPLSVGPGAAYRPPALARPAAPGLGLGCRPTLGPRRGLHLELFAHRQVILVAPGIGVAGARRDGARIAGGGCFGPLVTLDPTGVVELGPAGRRLRLGDLFAVWGQPVSRTRLAGFGGARVRAWVDGRAVGGDPAAITLRAHQEIVLEIAGYVPPHVSYGFPPGL
jgi:hypothetical protein